MITLQDEHLRVTVLPEHGGDIASIVANGIELLFQTPWGRRDRTHLPPRADSQIAWLDRYGGGWQVLCPNAGFEREVGGVRWGYHGEACLLPWDVRAADERSAELEVALATVPLRIHRRLWLGDGVLRVEERLRNDSPVDVEVAWIQHPAFGPPLVDGARLEAGARRVRADADIPGDLLVAGGVWDWPSADGVDLRVLPRGDQPRAVFGSLEDFTTHEAAIVNDALGLGVHLSWSGDAWPSAWLWQEVHATPGYPWFRRAHAVAVEPANMRTHVPGGGERAGWVELRLTHRLTN
jgi:hypothetical protein